jgi:hypothetical protein
MHFIYHMSLRIKELLLHIDSTFTLLRAVFTSAIAELAFAMESL